MPTLLNKNINELMPQDFEDFKILRLEQGVSEEGVNTDLRSLKRIFNFALENNFIESSPLRQVKRINSVKKDVRYFTALTEFHKKFSIAFACFALGILAVPLGIQSQLAKRSFGLGLGLFFFLLYYLMLSAGWVFGETGVYPPVIGMWLPNVIVLSIGGVLIFKNANLR